MNILGHSVRFLVLLVNLFIGACLLFCAYSSFISPVEHPVLACAGLCLPFFGVANLLLFFFWLLVKRKYIVFPLLFFIAGGEALWTYSPFNLTQSGEGGEVIKVLTYNTMGMRTERDAEGKQTNPILEYLKKSDADIVCLQEYPVRDRRIRKELGKAYPYIKTLSVNESYGLACLSKFPILSVKRIPYASANNGSMLLRIKMEKDTLAVICNHLESNKLNSQDKEMYEDLLKSPDEQKVKTEGKHLLRKLADAVAIRAVQADSVARSIEKNRCRYMIVCGDFNDSPVSYAHRVISRNLQDAYVEAGFGPGFSYNQNFLYFRIDHILATETFKVLNCKVDRSITASDHYPVWSLLEKKN